MISVSVIEAKFRRAKLHAKSTFLYSQLDAQQKNIIQKRVSQSQGERLVIYYYKDLNYSWLISNERLIVLKEDEVFYYPYKDIQRIEFPKNDDLKRDKAGIDSVDILLTKGNLISLFVESTTWHFIYALLKFLRPD
ncbi:MAG: hypothetical protein JST75_05095 [Bacteroidetes bacterium]|nr:hypothetical protein [Bacteroidota bacterium]